MTQDLFTKLVSIPSPSGGESEIGKFVRDELSKEGFETTIDNEGNVLGKFEGLGSPVLLSAHLDTVQGATKVRPVASDGVIRSAGNTILGGDNKASVSSILTAITKTPRKKRKTLEVVFSVREETDGGVSAIDLSWLKSKVGISADSGEPIGAIVNRTPFIEGFQIQILGVSSHSSEPEKGINALSLSSYAISQLKWGNIDELSTANIGLIEGGTAVNATPGRIVLTGEIRSHIKENIYTIRKDIEHKFRASAKIFGGKVRFAYFSYCDGYSHTGSEESYKKVRKIYTKLKIKEFMRQSFGGSDANFFNKMGISVVDIGDGVFNPHTDKEYIKVKDLNKLTNIFSAYISA